MPARGRHQRSFAPRWCPAPVDRMTTHLKRCRADAAAPGKDFVMARSTQDYSNSRLGDLVQGSHAAVGLVEALKHLNSLQRTFARHATTTLISPVYLQVIRTAGSGRRSVPRPRAAMTKLHQMSLLITTGCQVRSTQQDEVGAPRSSSVRLRACWKPTRGLRGWLLTFARLSRTGNRLGPGRVRRRPSKPRSVSMKFGRRRRVTG